MAKVLVVEDDQDIRELIADSLEDLGYEVLQAADGLAGIELALSQNPDVMLLDVMMPGLDGFEVLIRIMDTPATNSIPVIMLSARGHERDIREALNNGAADYVTKPWNPDDLESKVIKAQRRQLPASSAT
jgi:two-component system alkaline phosphatase synthesis response regulator PhoP